jgi:hypothetical protein
MRNEQDVGEEKNKQTSQSYHPVRAWLVVWPHALIKLIQQTSSPRRSGWCLASSTINLHILFINSNDEHP